MFTSRNYPGFTLVELLTVVSIISIITTAAIIGSINVSRRATYQVVYDSIYEIIEGIELARLNTGQRLRTITGVGCTECACRGAGNMGSAACWNNYRQAIDRINVAAGSEVIKGYPRDPWGNPYLINENEGEAWGTCQDDNGDGIACCADIIAAAGPNRQTVANYDFDDVVRNFQPICRPLEGEHHPNQPLTDVAP
ncbi:MAG: prepilin-type N-terminal cleavage/methylation domain-containing protein [Candidatus Roizmanbacteria bacterium]|nr:prepilin-type N-terminal cleavage/methylation domain-containing protein [Candidatus Roizmanbacteria bacterium]